MVSFVLCFVCFFVFFYSRTLPRQTMFMELRYCSAASEIFLVVFFDRFCKPRKYFASNSTSPSRSRNGGIWIGKADRRKTNSFLNLPRATASSVWRVVAAITRTSTGNSRLPPRRITRPVSSTRRWWVCCSFGFFVFLLCFFVFFCALLLLFL